MSKANVRTAVEAIAYTESPSIILRRPVTPAGTSTVSWGLFNQYSETFEEKDADFVFTNDELDTYIELLKQARRFAKDGF